MAVEMVGIYKITMSIPTDSPNMQIDQENTNHQAEMQYPKRNNLQPSEISSFGKLEEMVLKCPTSIFFVTNLVTENSIKSGVKLLFLLFS